MKILLKRWLNPNDNEEQDWFKTNLKECIEHTEGNGYWKKDTVKNELEKGKIINTPFAEYVMR